MTDQTRVPDLEADVALLRELALDLRWSWNHATDELWSRLDPELWTRTHNPWLILHTVSQQRLGQALTEREFRASVERLTELAREATSADTHWFGRTYRSPVLQRVGYFSMEFMLSEALPIYAGGLGNVAGDPLKAASDLGVPIVGVSLLYQQGYFRQVIARDGSQQALYPYNEPEQLPIRPLRLANGEWLRLKIGLRGHELWLRAWQAKVGRVHLYLLDSNDGANYARAREHDTPHRRLFRESLGAAVPRGLLPACGHRVPPTGRQRRRGGSCPDQPTASTQPRMAVTAFRGRLRRYT